MNRKLPLVGLGTCYYEFSKENPDAGVRRIRAARLRPRLPRVRAPGRGVLLVAWLGPVMEAVIREVTPELVEKVRQIAPKFFANLLRFYNHFTGEAVTTDLSPREFYLAQQLVDGSSYKEIAAKLNMTSGQVNNVVAAIYRKLGIHGKTELKKFV